MITFVLCVLITMDMVGLTVTFELKLNNNERSCPVNMEQYQAHMGYTISEVGNLTNIDNAGLTLIRRKLLEHGVVVVKSQNLTRAEQVRFSGMLGQAVLLPPSFYSKDFEPGFPEIHRATNYWANGTWKGQDHCFGCDWHKDGDFQQNGYLASILYADEVVANKSATFFLDNCQVMEKVAKSTLQFLSKTVFTISVRDIPDFVNGSEEDFALFPVVKKHAGIYRHPGNGRECAFITNILVTESKRDLEAAWKDVVEKSPKYVHYWTPGDVVIWDNLAVMHRAGTKGLSGPGDRNPRMLYRTQTFLD